MSKELMDFSVQIDCMFDIKINIESGFFWKVFRLFVQ